MPYLIFSISRRAPTLFLLLWLVVPAMAAAAAASDEAAMNTGHPMPPLSEREADVLLRKATEAPYTGRYLNNHAAGTYICRQCGMPLYHSEDRYSYPQTNSTPAAAGPVLTTPCPARCAACPMPTGSGWKFSARIAAGIWGMFLKAKASRTRIPAIASIPCP